MAAVQDLAGKNALVTGSGVRIGRAISLGLAQAGANLALHYHSSDQAVRKTASRAGDLGVQTVLVRADLSDPSRANELIDQASAQLGPIDLLVNNAAIFGDESFSDLDLESWQRHMAINLASPIFLSRAFAAAYQGPTGAILNMLDWRALRPGADHFPYTISKAGLAAATLSLAQALAPDIRVNGLALGAILPPPGVEEKEQGPIRAVPLGRWGELEEVVETALFLLAGPGYITGEIIHLDGGRHLT